ncbi:cytochrome P450 [Mycena floridula]|nr:cytochrome P450 [Mycena floridula]
MTRPFFSKDRISDFDIFDRHAEDVINQMKARLAQGYPIEFQDAIAWFTLDSATEYLFGKDICSLLAGLPFPESMVNDHTISQSYNAEHPANQFAEAFALASPWGDGDHFTTAAHALGQLHASLRTQSGKHWPLMEMKHDELIPLCKIINEFVDPIIDEVLEKRRTLSPDTKEEEDSFLVHLVRHTQDYQVLQDELINLLVAGQDTTASTLTFAVYILSQRPDILTCLQKEVFEQVGATKRPTYDDIQDMKYLRAFINGAVLVLKISAVNSSPTETLRLYPVYVTSNPYIFVPFNAGPRICIGQQPFAYNESSFFLIRLLQSFAEISLTLDVQPESLKSNLVLNHTKPARAKWPLGMKSVRLRIRKRM